jgi:hypothetical protein
MMLQWNITNRIDVHVRCLYFYIYYILPVIDGDYLDAAHVLQKGSIPKANFN